MRSRCRPVEQQSCHDHNRGSGNWRIAELSWMLLKRDSGSDSHARRCGQSRSGTGGQRNVRVKQSAGIQQPKQYPTGVELCKLLLLARLAHYWLCFWRRIKCVSGSDYVMHDSQPAIGSHNEPLLQAIHITKRYGAFAANDSISIDVLPAEIHALLGENGAGKSTLVKIMYGLVQPTVGRTPLARREDRIGRPLARARARHRHGVPALFAVRKSDCRRERRAGIGADRILRLDFVAARRGVARLRLAARTEPRGVAVVGRRAPAHRNRSRLDAESQVC